MAILDTPPPQTDEYVPSIGRLHAPDPRDREVPRRLVRQAADVRYRYWSAGPLLNQGQSSECVAYSTEALLRSSPVRQAPFCRTREMYDWMQDNDEWPGREPSYYGTSTRACLRWLVAHGYSTSYEFARSADELAAHILLRNPAFLGVDWHMGMFDVDRFGFIRASGPVAGGHQVLVDGVSRDKIDPVTRELGVFRIRNSWGPWGYRNSGWCFLSFSDCNRLLNADGDAGLPVEIKRGAL